MTKGPVTASELREGAEALAADQDYAHANLAAALVAALSDLTVIEKGSKATIPMKSGGTYTYDFADLPSIVKATRKALGHHGIVALTPVHDHPTGLACTVVLLHRSGDRMDFGPFPFPAGRDAQATGSAVTYHRRYALVAALGMAAGDDDDGAAAVKGQQEQFVWTAGAVKARLVERLGDKDKAAEAWKLGHGDDLTDWSREVADRLADDWLANQPAEAAS